MSSTSRRWSGLVAGALALAVAARPGVAGNVSGRLDIATLPERPELTVKGFLERVENPLANPRPVAVLPYMVVVLEQAEGAKRARRRGR